jgi:asparagine synthase (glutamine-hydrolysing)
MSVQAGIWSFEGKPVDPTVFNDLRRGWFQHGPDGEFYHEDKAVTMVYRAFHTTSESRGESQPYVSRSGLVITWDGRLDNREELENEFGRELSAASPDVVLFAAIFEHCGTEAFRHLVGDWAVVVWHPQIQELVLAVDYIGVRHLYYKAESDRVTWCSLLKPLVPTSRGADSLSEEYIAGYLALYPPGELTPYRDVNCVGPGTVVRITRDNVIPTRYWHFDPTAEILYGTDAEYEEHFRHVFRQAVRCRLRSDVPILAELSGGLDSSSIVGMADDVCANQGHATMVDTISHFNHSDPEGGDYRYFRMVEERRGRNGFHVDTAKFCVSFPLEQPMTTTVPGLVWSSDLESQRVAVIRQGGYRITLSGLGGDEFLGGVPDHRPLIADLLVASRYRDLIEQLQAWSLAKRQPCVQLLWSSFRLLAPFHLRALLMKESALEKMLDPRFVRRTSFRRLTLGTAESFGYRRPSSREYARTVTMMGWQRAQCQPSPDVYIEYRYPFLDQRLLEFLISIPATQLIRPGERRSLMRRSLSSLLPPEVASRKTKATGGKSYVVAVNRQWHLLEAMLESPLCCELGFVNRDGFRRALLEVKNGMATDLIGVLRVLFLELWLRGLCQVRPPSLASMSSRSQTFESSALAERCVE